MMFFLLSNLLYNKIVKNKDSMEVKANEYLQEKMLVVCEKCGFATDNLIALVLGVASEVGELSSLIALSEGIKKPKPKDLEKFGWEKNWNGQYKIERSMFVEYADKSKSGFEKSLTGPFEFEGAWTHEATKKALKKEIEAECADILIYLFQIAINQGFDLKPGTEKELDTEKHFDFDSNPILVLILLQSGFAMALCTKKMDANGKEIMEQASNKAYGHLVKLAAKYEIDLDKSFAGKCETLLKRHAK